MENEFRIYDNPVEIRKNEAGEDVITGYGVVFNSDSQDLGGFIETVAPTAFRNADMSDVIANFNHDNNFVLGRTPMTLTLTVDNVGVRYEIKPPDTTQAKDLMVSIARGDVRGSSFKFNIAKDGDKWEKPKEKGGLYRRLITSVSKLWDLGPVTSPAYLATDATLAKRSLGMLKDKEEIEVTDNIAKVDELERIKIKRQNADIDMVLAYHDGFKKLEAQERELQRKKDKLRMEFDKIENKQKQQLLDEIERELNKNKED